MPILFDSIDQPENRHGDLRFVECHECVICVMWPQMAEEAWPTSRTSKRLVAFDAPALCHYMKFATNEATCIFAVTPRIGWVVWVRTWEELPGEVARSLQNPRF